MIKMNLQLDIMILLTCHEFFLIFGTGIRFLDVSELKEKIVEADNFIVFSRYGDL